ncbi:hypothetical protein EVG20_g7843 [Dentipellis fragilis]|uniref:AB hydrolase-1 domain-containing protein n=1 Tax=Dentipellis fragilis TaxID=205917 RepID=A0A4Y9YEI7_9AGAM|nr:hypothetical protein EVG20_g7843 [Dentipellis fragilis]
MSVSEGTIPFTVAGETYQTWYKVFGDLKNRKHRPLIALHGGPGLVHDYMTPFGDLVASHNIPVILYDQLGNGKSTHLRDKPESFWTIDLFVDELVNLLQHFGVQDDFDLVGHSWGGILGVEFEIRRQPQGLKHLVLADSLPSMALWNQSNMQLLQPFPQEIKEGIMAGLSDPDRYHKALLVYHAEHGCRIKPFPAEFLYTLDQVRPDVGDITVSKAMFSGPFKEWTVVDQLHQVRVPTLIYNGRYDISQDFVCAPFFQRIPKAKWVTFEKSSHLPQWEERERVMQVVGSFLQ